MTYSLVARDARTGALGIAVHSHFFGVGRVVGWARPGVGAVATQAFAEAGYGPRGLDLMAAGATAPEALAQLTGADAAAALRQVAFVDADGRCAAHTGAGCLVAAGHAFGDQVSAQGNMLASERVWPAMLDAYAAAAAAGEELPARLLAGLDAAEAAGGDLRGRQSASIFVVAAEPRERPWDAVLADCRVDDHPEPLVELRRLVSLNGFYARLLELMGAPGVLSGSLSDDDAALDAALADLAAGRALLGVNQEAAYWHGVLLARRGDHRAAREQLAAAFAAAPQLAEFLRRSAPGLFPGDWAAVLAAVAAPRSPDREAPR